MTESLERIAPFVEKLELELEKTRSLPFTTPKQKTMVEAAVTKLARKHLETWKAQLETILQREYKISLNKDVQGAKEKFGEATQKRKFKKRENIKELNLDVVFKRMETVVMSLVAVEMEYHRRKLAMNLLFAKEAE